MANWTLKDTPIKDTPIIPHYVVSHLLHVCTSPFRPAVRGGRNYKTIKIERSVAINLDWYCLVGHNCWRWHSVLIVVDRHRKGNIHTSIVPNANKMSFRCRHVHWNYVRRRPTPVTKFSSNPNWKRVFLSHSRIRCRPILDDIVNDSDEIWKDCFLSWETSISGLDGRYICFRYRPTSDDIGLKSDLQEWLIQ